MENKKENILIIGQNCAATALAKKLAKDTRVEKIFIAPGNKIQSEGNENIDIREDDLTGLLKFALENNITLTVPASEKALKSDVVSFFMSNGQNIFGPAQESCDIALNKSAGKKFLYKIHAQTSKFGIFDKILQAEDFLKNAQFPVTIKCSDSTGFDERLTCATNSIAREFLETLFSIKNETSVLLEEFTYGHTFTVYYITDGYNALSLCPVGNYKFMQDGECGLLTKGMGCYSPDYKISQTVISRINNIVNNTLSAINKKTEPYVGILGVECTLTGEDKFFVNEFKPFLQDYDAAAVLSLIDDNLIDIFHACIEGLFSDEYDEIRSNDLSSVSALVYSSKSNKLITEVQNIDSSEIDFFNTLKPANDMFLTTKGEAFVLTKTASTLFRAKTSLYETLEDVNFEGMKFRRDILK